MKAHEFIACPRERYKQGETSRDGFSYIKGVVSNVQGETRYWVLECFRGGLQTGSVAPISYMFSVEELSAYVIEVGSRMVDYSFARISSLLGTVITFVIILILNVGFLFMRSAVVSLY